MVRALRDPPSIRDSVQNQDQDQDTRTRPPLPPPPTPDKYFRPPPP